MSADDAAASELVASANARAEAGEMSEAAALFRRAAALHDSAHIWEPLAQCLLELGASHDAADAASRAVRLAPEWDAARVTLARACLNAKLFADAAHHFRAAAAMVPADDEALAVDIAEDLAMAERLLREQDDKELVIEGRRLKLQQWRELRRNDTTSATPRAASCVPCKAGCEKSDYDSNYDSTGEGAAAAGRIGTGTVIWECGIVLAKYLELHADALLRHGRATPPRVLELGAGVGTAGLAAAALGNA